MLAVPVHSEPSSARNEKGTTRWKQVAPKVKRTMSNTHSVFYDAITACIDELPQGKDAPCHRRVPKTSQKDPDVCSPQTAESKLARPSRSTRAHDRSALYDYFVACGPHGATREEAGRACGLHSNTYYPRCSELIHDGKLVVKSGERRKTLQGNAAAVLAADIYAVRL